MVDFMFLIISNFREYIKFRKLLRLEWGERKFYKESMSLFSGFANVKAACCGLGELNAQIPCLPISSICSNRKDHIFWDAFHPTEAAARIFVDEIFNGPSKYISPINMEQLLAIWIG